MCGSCRAAIVSGDLTTHVVDHRSRRGNTESVVHQQNELTAVESKSYGANGCKLDNYAPLHSFAPLNASKRL
jgi:hypothetical protein